MMHLWGAWIGEVWGFLSSFAAFAQAAKARLSKHPWNRLHPGSCHREFSATGPRQANHTGRPQFNLEPYHSYCQPKPRS